MTNIEKLFLKKVRELYPSAKKCELINDELVIYFDVKNNEFGIKEEGRHSMLGAYTISDYDHVNLLMDELEMLYKVIGLGSPRFFIFSFMFTSF